MRSLTWVLTTGAFLWGCPSFDGLTLREGIGDAGERTPGDPAAEGDAGPSNSDAALPPARDASARSDANDPLPAAVRVTTLTGGEGHSCAHWTDGRIKCWGENGAGQLGLGTTDRRGDGAGEIGASLPFVDFGVNRFATSITARNDSTCVRLDDGQVQCWGLNSFGKLGLGDTRSRGGNANERPLAIGSAKLGAGRSAVTVASGWDHVCAILDDARVKCWGRNESGQLGLGDSSFRGDAPGEMGDVLPPVDLGTGRTAKALALGGFHTCVILDDDRVKCWGYNAQGQLGRGDEQSRGDSPGELGDNLGAIDLGAGRTARAIACGRYHTCAVLDDGKVKCWGNNAYGQLGLGDTSDRGDDAGEMGDALVTVDLGTGRKAQSLVAAERHSCALLDDGRVKCWGYNGQGQLGLGNTQNMGDGAGEMGDLLPPIDFGSGRSARVLGGGHWHTCAALDDDRVKCWGYNAQGQLGLEDTQNRADEPSEVGAGFPAVNLR